MQTNITAFPAAHKQSVQFCKCVFSAIVLYAFITEKILPSKVIELIIYILFSFLINKIFDFNINNFNNKNIIVKEKCLVLVLRPNRNDLSK